MKNITWKLTDNELQLVNTWSVFMVICCMINNTLQCVHMCAVVDAKFSEGSLSGVCLKGEGNSQTQARRTSQSGICSTVTSNKPLEDATAYETRTLHDILHNSKSTMCC